MVSGLSFGKTMRDPRLSKKEPMLFGLFVLSLVFFLLARFIPSSETGPLRGEMIAASRTMADAMALLRECRETAKLAIDPDSDVNRTGIIGIRSSTITTTLGSLEAKRTTTNPNFAGLVVSLLREAGVKPGDAIAVGASGSFPGLILAVLAAAKTMDVTPLVQVSLCASQWGANHPEFHWLHMQTCLQKNGILPFQPIAISVGGDKDRGADLPEEGRILLIHDMEGSEIPVIIEDELKTNVETRMRLYFEKAFEKKIKAFVNIGGSWANLGIDSEILHVRPGIGKISRFPPEDRQGVLYAMAAQDIPVIHLLYVKGLVQGNGLPWDPVPLPRPGEGDLYRMKGEDRRSFLVISAAYLVLFVAVVVFGMRRST
jgi:poly-gamma-glutamate system protein